MTEKIIYSDKLTYQIEASRGMKIPDNMHNFDYWKFIRMLKLAGFDLWSDQVITEYLKHEEHKDGTVEFSTDWVTCTGYKPLIVLKDNATENYFKKSVIYKHALGHLSIRRSRKINIKGDNYKNIILGRSCRGVGFPSIKNSFVQKFDLDNHNYDLLDDTERKERETLLKNIINDMIKDKGAFPLYIAKSLSHGYHVYFRVSDPEYSKPGYKSYFCKTYGYQETDIEISLTTKGFRIPGHWTYIPGTWDKELGFIPDENRTDYIDRFLNCYDDPEYMSQCDNYRLWLMGLTEDEYQEIMSGIDTHSENEDTKLIIKPEPVIELKPDKKNTKIYSKNKIIPFNRKLIKNGTININEIAAKYPIAARIRNHNIYAIYCQTAHTDFETFVETVFKADTGTSDEWSRKSTGQKIKLLQMTWNSGQKRRTGTTKTFEKSNGFISNEHLVHKSYKTQYENPLIITHLLKECGLGSVYSTVNEKHQKAMTIFLTELHGYLVYQAQNKRTLSNQYEDRTDLCKGFIAPKAWCDAMQKHYKIPFKVYLTQLKIRNYLAQHLGSWKPIVTKDDRYYQHFGIAYCIQFGEGAYRDNTGAMASSFMGLIIRFIKSLYSSTKSTFSFKVDSSTYMWSNSLSLKASVDVNRVIQPPG